MNPLYSLKKVQKDKNTMVFSYFLEYDLNFHKEKIFDYEEEL